MRLRCLLPACLALASVGCSSLIARSGTDPYALADREQVHRMFGTPSTSKTSETESFEEFRTRRKFSEEDRVAGLNLCGAVTLGLSEFYVFPAELCRLGWRTVAGQTLRVNYGADGKVTGVSLNGEYLRLDSNNIAAASDKAKLAEIHPVVDESKVLWPK